MIKYKYSKLYWFIKDLEWVKVYFSPFKPIIPKLYIGKVAIGVPYFYPRVWVKATPKLALEATLKHIKNTNEWNEKNPNYPRRVKTFSEVYDDKMDGSYPVPKKIGFNFVPLGWKTKFDSYRHEWNPIWSFVFFKWQIALIFAPKHDIHYWECWLYYSRETNKTKSTKERIKEAKEEYCCVWSSTKDGVDIKTNYWDLILKKKYFLKKLIIVLFLFSFTHSYLVFGQKIDKKILLTKKQSQEIITELYSPQKELKKTERKLDSLIREQQRLQKEIKKKRKLLLWRI